jgi:hypothetical protein
MKAIRSSFLLMLIAVFVIACNAQSPKDQNMANDRDGDLQVYYFHFTKRCATCNAVENETRMALETFYSDQVKKGKISFTSLNLEEEDGKAMAQELNVSGQTLLLVKGNEMVNLTNDGFMNARTKPDKFHEILKSNIDKLL